MHTVIEYLLEHKDKLELFTSALTRAHVDAHPEVLKVRALYLQMQEKVQNQDASLGPEFASLQTVTSNYKVPGDVCKTYEQTYKLLETANELYNEGR